MGEYADDEIFGGLDQEWGFYRPFKPREKQVKTCNKCGFTPLYWIEYHGAWRLHRLIKEKFVLHDCREDNPPQEIEEVKREPSNICWDRIKRDTS